MAADSGTRRHSAVLNPIGRRQGFAISWAVATAVLTSVFLATLIALSSRFPMSWDWFVPLSLLIGALLALVILWKGPQWQTAQVKGLNRKERFDSENEARKTLATILGGIVLLVGGYATWRNIKLAQESLKVSQQSSATSQKALSVAQEGQITDRFTKAIEQLGAVDAEGVKKMVVRLGGIYALERIANESERDHWPIMEVLCTYVRNVAPNKPESPTRKTRALSQGTNSRADKHPEPDIQAILTVLGRRYRKSEGPNQYLSLANVDLRGAYLNGLDFGGVYFRRADLSAAYLEQAKLNGAYLHEANLNGADLRGAYLEQADLTQADLSRADLGRPAVRPSESNHVLPAASLRGADLSEANVCGADLSDALDLTQAQIDAAKGDSFTKLPTGLHMPERWKK